MGFSKEDAIHIRSAFNEALYNVMIHAYRGQKTCLIITEFREYPDRLEIWIKDHGGQVPRSKIQARPLDEFRNSGLGLYIMEEVMDYLHYDTSFAEGTELTMVKNLVRDG